MAGVEDPAQFIGEVFARQYYSMLQESPEEVWRFYRKASKIGKVDSDDGFMWSTTRIKAINEKIESYGSLKADVKFVDAQESYNEGLMVLVYGSMVNEDDSRRNFTQTFFLAPQDNGYYVANDIFRYVNDDDPDSNQQGGGISRLTLDNEPPPIEENHASEQSNLEVYNSSGELPAEAVKGEFQVEEKFEEKEVLAEEVDESVQESWVVVESSVKEPVAQVADETPQESSAK